MPATFMSAPLDAAKIALVPPRQLAISREPAANASVCLAPDVISGNVTFTPSFSKPLTIVPLFLSTILGIFSGALTYVTRSSVTGAAAFLAGSLPPQPAPGSPRRSRPRNRPSPSRRNRPHSRKRPHRSPPSPSASRPTSRGAPHRRTPPGSTNRIPSRPIWRRS